MVRKFFSIIFSLLFIFLMLDVIQDIEEEFFSVVNISMNTIR